LVKEPEDIKLPESKSGVFVPAVKFFEVMV